MEKILGIDLGTNSIGWAIREIETELENQIIDKGVLTFDKGVAEDKSGEHPMVQKRTENRGKRRNYQAEKYRKWSLLECLIENNMCPLTIDELNKWRHYTKGIGRNYPQSEKFIQWLRFDFDGDGKPDFERFGFSKNESYYLFRSLIVDETTKEIFKNEPNIIGRILYQLVQRRGYNDGSEIDENEKNELSKYIMKGGGDAGAIGANDIEPYIEKYKTLGAALYNIQKEKNVRIRKRYNLRSKYEAEIKEICRIQNLEHLYKQFWAAIIWQRPLRSQKGLVGICTFENNKSRCPISHPLYEEYRTWVFINNLKIRPTNKENLNQEELQKVLTTIVYPEFYKAAPDFKLSVIKKKIEKAGCVITAKFPDDTKVNSVQFLYRIKEIFGEDWSKLLGWNNILSKKIKEEKNRYDIEDLWHIHFTKTSNKNTGETAFDFLQRFGNEKLQLVDEKSKAFAKINLQQGYATLSVSALKKIIPYLQKGHIYSEAIYLANLPKVLGKKEVDEETINYFSIEVRKIMENDKQEKKYFQVINELINDQLNATHRHGMDSSYRLDQDDLKDIDKKILNVFGYKSWERLSDNEKENLKSLIAEKYLGFLQKRILTKGVFEKTERLHDKIFNWISDTYGINEKNIKYLWHPSEQETYKNAIEKNGIKYLGSPEPISKGFKNPMALKTLHKLKKLINYLLEIGKIDEDTRVVIEIARELNDANKRKAIERWQRDREAQNNIYKNQIIEINKECKTTFNENDKNFIDKIRLWEEQKRCCIYTGKTIGLCDVLNGSKYDYEHSVPAPMSFDNELKNLTIADKTYNQQVKGKKLPSECPNYNTDALGFTAIIPRLDFIREKVEEFEIKYERSKYFAKIATTKESKDNNIVSKHMAKMDLDYWRYKLQTFTITEYKSGWRNSQLRDTQTITKYSLPYLKTVFKKVEVQKGNITADFRKIYKIQLRLDKKDRTKHSHHAIDAAVLTLIPTAAIRDKILEKYNEANENNIGYHELPRQWKEFKSTHIIKIEDEILINYLPEHRTLTQTKKQVRKRGKIQFVKQKLADGKWQYKLNEKGDKIPLIAKGDTIRGQLHADSFYAALKQPEYKFKNDKFIPVNDNNGNFIFQKNEKRGDNIFICKKIFISEMKTFEDLEIIIDPNLRYYLQKTLENKDFKNEILKPIWAFGKKEDKNGNSINPLRHIRCKVKGGGGGFVANPAIIRKRKDFLSTHPYKNNYYAQNGETVVCAMYQDLIEGKVIRELKTHSILDVATVKGIKNIAEAVPANFEKTIKKIKYLIPLLCTLQQGQKVLFYKHEFDELKTIDRVDLVKRLYTIIKFEEGKISFKYNLNSMKEDDVTNEMKRLNLPTTGASSFDFKRPNPKLRLSQGSLNMAIENIHFNIKPDGQIMWKF